jgi:hypothetical protein
MSEETYGGITRSSKSMPYYSGAGCGVLTLEMLQNAFANLEEAGRAEEKREREFYDAIRPFNKLLDEKDYIGYLAAYRLVRSAFYVEACLHPKNYAEYVEILKGRSLWPIPLDSQSR